MQQHLMRAGFVGVATLTALAGVALPGYAAPPPPSLIYVSPTGGVSGDNSSCAQASQSSIQTAVDLITTGGTVVVCAGTYQESVTVSQRLTLKGDGAPVIDATGHTFGISLGADYVTVDGFVVQNAQVDTENENSIPGDGIVTAALTEGGPVVANFATIINNVARNNDGNGIDVESSHGAVVSNNRSGKNGVGINVVADFGPAYDNVISNNVANRNGGGCGIVLADHSGAGVYSNEVSGNTANWNGLDSPVAPNASSGSGIILATPAPNGMVKDNRVVNNMFRGNGHAGIALHAHTSGADFSGNYLAYNNISRNNTHYDYKDKHTTGIYLGSVDPLKIRAVRNYIHGNYYGIFMAGDITVKGRSTNTMVNVTHRYGSTPTYPSFG